MEKPLPSQAGRLVGTEGQLWGPRGEHNSQSCADRQHRVRATQMVHSPANPSLRQGPPVHMGWVLECGDWRAGS